jgi:hypothetical protein
MRKMNLSGSIQRRATSTAIAALALAGVLAAAGCESDPARQKANKAVATLTDTKAEIAAGRGEVERAVTNLGKLEAKPAKLTPAFNDFKASVAAVKRRSDIINSRVQDMRLRAAEYSNAWQNDAQQISSPELRDVAQARNERVTAQYEKVTASAQAVRDAYAPFITQLGDTERYLANDLTYNGIDAAAPMFDTVRSTADELLRRIDALSRDLDATSARLSPTTTPTP